MVCTCNFQRKLPASMLMLSVFSSAVQPIRTWAPINQEALNALFAHS